MTTLFNRPCLALLAGLFLLTGCSPDAPEALEETPSSEIADETQAFDDAGADAEAVLVQGRLMYRSRIALEPESQALIELLELQPEQQGERQVAEQRIGLLGREVPVNFSLAVPRAAMEGGPYRLRASIDHSGKLAWQTDPIALARLEEDLDLGELILLPVRSAGFSSILHCGQLQVSAGYEADDLILQVASQRYRLLPVQGESSARFEAEGDPATRFSSRGDTALLTLGGQLYPECVAPGVLPMPFLAHGNEPGWELRIEQERLSLVRADELLVEGEEYQMSREDNEHQTYLVEAHPEVAIQVQRRVCQDSMSGIPYPFQVSVQAGAEALNGCGGQPERLLQGVDWVVQQIGDQTVVDGSRVSLMFYPNNRFAGRASCNNLTGEYAITGEALGFSRTATTRKACEPALMEQEQRFIELLGRVNGFAVDDEGALSLRTPQGEELKARRD